MYSFGKFELHPDQRSLTLSGEPIPLTPKGFDLLFLLVASRGRLVSKAEIQRALWPDTNVEEGNVAFQVSALRKALGEDAVKWIETVPKYGYRFVADVTARSTPAESSAPPSATVATTRTPRARTIAVAGAVTAIAVATIVVVASRTEPDLEIASPQPLTTFEGDELTPSIAPNGKDVAFVWDGISRDNWDIYVKLSGVEEPLRITTSNELDFNPDWSPDGRTLAFARQTAEGGIDILVKPYPDGPEQRVARARACFMFPAQYEKVLDWHSDGEHLVVAGVEPGKSCGLSAVSVATGAVTPITEPPLPSMKDISPAVAPDGHALAFMRGSTWGTFTVYTIALNGLSPAGAARPISEEDRMETWPAWLPDSKEIVFSSGDALFRATPSGTPTKEVQVPVSDTTFFAPSISKEFRLAYSTRPPYRSTLHRLEFPSGPSVAPTVSDIAPSTYHQQNPVFSPDGQKIAFESERSGHREVWVCSPDGSDLRQVTRFDGPTVQSPRWSPDGTQIACSVLSRGQRELYVVDAQRGTPTRLTFNTYDEPGAAWSPDGRWLYLSSNRSGEYQVWKMPATGGEARQLTKSGGLMPQTSPDGRFVYFVKEGPRPTLWQVPADGGPETLVMEGPFQSGGPVAVEDGLYFIVSPEQHRRSPAPEVKVQFLHLPSGQVREVARVAGPIGWGIAVAPDRRSMIFVRLHLGTFDLRVVDRVP